MGRVLSRERVTILRACREMSRSCVHFEREHAPCACAACVSVSLGYVTTACCVRIDLCVLCVHVEVRFWEDVSGDLFNNRVQQGLEFCRMSLAKNAFLRIGLEIIEIHFVFEGFRFTCLKHAVFFGP